MATVFAPGISPVVPGSLQQPEAAITGTVQTYYCANPQQSSSSAGLLATTVPPASTSTTGWTVGTTAAPAYSRQSFGVEQAVFVAAIQPAGPPVTTAAHLAEDCWRTSSATSGVFSRGTWYSSLSVIAVTNASSQAGRLQARIWRSTDPGGANAIEITDPSRPMLGNLTGALSTTVAVSSVASVSLPVVILTNEYLFYQTSWKITTAGTNAAADVLIRLGSMSTNDGSGIQTSAFSGTVAAPAGGGAPKPGYYLQYYRAMVEENL
jgi:hypothetical protein